MDLYDVMAKRRSFRGYDPGKPVEDEKLKRIAEAVRLAPSACNRQPIRLLLVRDPAIRAEICRVYSQPWLKEAPVIAVMLGCDEAAWKRPEGDSIVPVDAAIAMEHFVLAAAAEGLGTCWICAFLRDAMDKAAGVKAPWRSVAVSPLGYARENVCRPFVRKDVSELVQVIG